jgi:hypothetical protein
MPQPELLEERREVAAQRVALFWIMALGSAKFRLRGWDVAVHAMLTDLRAQVEGTTCWSARALALHRPARPG